MNTSFWRKKINELFRFEIASSLTHEFFMKILTRIFFPIFFCKNCPIISCAKFGTFQEEIAQYFFLQNEAFRIGNSNTNVKKKLDN